jgi:hypothetical protein
MAQIIKHRRGGITTLKDVTARKGELIIATGSIGDMNGPWMFVGDTDGVAGAYKAASKIYQGSNAPTLTAGSHGSVLDGTPFYASGNESLYILSQAGNTRLDLTGNIEGNLISGVTINNLTGTTANITAVSSSMFTGSFKGDGTNLYNIPASGVTGLQLDKIADGAATASIDETDGLRINIKTEITGSLTVTSNSYLQGDLNVTGDTIFNDSVTITGLTDNRLVIVGTGGLLEDSANLTFDGTTFNIGQGQFEVDNSTGNIRTSGSITMKGNITIGDNQGGDIIDFNGEVSSSIIPSGSNLFDLGSPTNAWKDLYVSGTAFIENINIGGISTTNLYLPGDLTVSGTTTLSGSVLVEDLTEKRLVVVGADGQLVDYSGLTFDNGNLNLSGALEVTNIQGTGSLYLRPDLNDSRDFRIYNTAPSDIHIKGNAAYSFFGDDTNFLKIDDNTNTITIDSLSGVTINIDTTVSQSLSVDGHINLTGTRQIRVSDDTANTIYGFYDGSSILGSYYQMFGNNYSTATQRGGAEFVFDSRNSGTGGFNISEYNGSTWLRKLLIGTSTIGLTGSTTIDGDLTVTGTTELQDTLEVLSTSELKGAVGINSTLDVTGSAYFKNSLEVDGESTLASATVEDLTQYRLVVAGAGGSLEDYSGLTFNGTTLKIGNGQLEIDNSDGDIRTSGSLTVEGGQTINGDVTVNGVLTVTGNTQLQANLYVSGNLEVLGGATSVTIQSTTVELDDNIIRLNAYSPFERYTGFEVIDSGSTGVSASLVWDSLNDYWMFVSSSSESSKLIGTTAGTYGSEISLTNNTFPIATGPNTIGDSLLTMIASGTTLAFNTNKFTVSSTDGSTLIAGNLTLSFSGGTDNGSSTSAIVFRNNSNVLGYVSTTTSTVETAGLLGYKQSDGALVFSDLIDGGSY